MQFGWFYDGHRALADCEACLALLAQTLPKSGQRVMAEVREAARKNGLSGKGCRCTLRPEGHAEAARLPLAGPQNCKTAGSGGRRPTIPKRKSPGYEKKSMAVKPPFHRTLSPRASGIRSACGILPDNVSQTKRVEYKLHCRCHA